MLEVCSRLNKNHDIRTLFSKLKIEKHKIDTIFHDNKDAIEELVYQLMSEWLKRQDSRAGAYVRLWLALTSEEVNLSSIAHDVLKEEPDLPWWRQGTHKIYLIIEFL